MANDTKKAKANEGISRTEKFSPPPPVVGGGAGPSAAMAAVLMSAMRRTKEAAKRNVLVAAISSYNEFTRGTPPYHPSFIALR